MSLLPKRKIDRFAGLTLRDEVSRVFEDFLGERVLGIRPGEWMPALDMSETDSQVIVKAEVPGMEAKDIDVSIAGDTLTIKGEKKEETSKNERNLTQMERRYGFTERSVTLPSAVDQSKIGTSYKNGVLSIAMDKKEPSESRNIQVKVEQKPTSVRSKRAILEGGGPGILQECPGRFEENCQVSAFFC